MHKNTRAEETLHAVDFQQRRAFSKMTVFVKMRKRNDAVIHGAKRAVGSMLRGSRELAGPFTQARTSGATAARGGGAPLWAWGEASALRQSRGVASGATAVGRAAHPQRAHVSGAPQMSVPVKP